MGDDCKVYVSNLHFSITRQEQLEDAFSPFGKIISAQVVMDRETNKPKGYGFVTFASERDMQAAIDKMDGQILEGRALKVSKALTPAERDQRRSERGERPPYPPRGSRYDDDRDYRPRDYDRGPPPSKGYRISMTNLPDNVDWRALKDYLRDATGSQPTYADVKRPGFGVGEFPTSELRSQAIRALDGTTWDGHKLTVTETDFERSGDYERAPRRAPDSPSYRDPPSYRSDRPSSTSYAPRGERGSGYKDDPYYSRGAPDSYRDSYSARDGGSSYSRDPAGYDKYAAKEGGSSRCYDKSSYDAYPSSSSARGYRDSRDAPAAYDKYPPKSEAREAGYRDAPYRSERAAARDDYPPASNYAAGGSFRDAPPASGRGYDADYRDSEPYPYREPRSSGAAYDTRAASPAAGYKDSYPARAPADYARDTYRDPAYKEAYAPRAARDYPPASTRETGGSGSYSRGTDYPPRSSRDMPPPRSGGPDRSFPAANRAAGSYDRAAPY